MARPPVNADSRSWPSTPITGAAAISVDDNKVSCGKREVNTAGLTLLKTEIHLKNPLGRVSILTQEGILQRCRRFLSGKTCSIPYKGAPNIYAWNPLTF